jgi:esterase/lipase superfamily enzyme
MKSVDRWHSERLGESITVARWGVRGTPVLVFPTAGGDAEEIERHHLVGACGDLLAAGRVKLYSVDSVAGRALFAGEGSPQHQMWLLNQFHECMRHEVVPAMRADSAGFAGPLLATGSSIGAFNALAMLCRYPDQFGAAICLSGSYSLERFYGAQATPDLYVASPQLFLPGLAGPQLDQLRQRFVVLASGEGRWEDIGESWAMAHVLGAKGIPNRVDPWGPEWDHLWPTWWRMLPQYLAELT